MGKGENLKNKQTIDGYGKRSEIKHLDSSLGGNIFREKNENLFITLSSYISFSLFLSTPLADSTRNSKKRGRMRLFCDAKIV
jgi:hypothetical protein